MKDIQLYLHAAEADSYQSRRALLALADLKGFLLLCGVVSVLPRAHLQVQNARHGVPPRQVFQKDELCGKKLRRQNKSAQKCIKFHITLLFLNVVT